MLDVPATILSNLNGDNLRFAWLVAFPTSPSKDLLSTGVYFTDHATSLTVGSVTYESLGDIISLSPILRERGIKLQGYTISLAGADISYGASNGRWLAAQNMTGRSCEVSLVLLDAVGVIIGDEKIQMYRGTVQTVREKESSNSSTVEVVLTGPWSKPDLTAGRLTSENSQKNLHPNDDFFKYAHRERTNIGWGGEDD